MLARYELTIGVVEAIFVIKTYKQVFFSISVYSYDTQGFLSHRQCINQVKAWLYDNWL